VTFNDLPIIKCVYLAVFLVNYNMIKLIVKNCNTKKALVLQRIENVFL
jgi:glutamate racemase